MRGQLIPFVFLILLVFGVISSYVFFNIFYGTKYEREISKIKILNMMSNVIEVFKGYLKLSLSYSAHQALRESACFGGMISGQQPWAWICGGPNPLPAEESKSCSEKFIKYYLNFYASNFSTTLPVEIAKKNFTDCAMDIDIGEIFSGAYDEGNFWVNCTEASMNLLSKNLQIAERLNTSNFVTHNRFWYLFRIITDWANENYYGKCICSATIGCGDCNSVDQCAKEALKRLQQRFDDYVECKREESVKCCEHETGPPCNEPRMCLPWPSACQARCELECVDPPLNSSVCLPKGIVAASGNQNTYNIWERLRFSPTDQEISCFSIKWDEWRLAGQDLYWCEDHKYYVPSPNGPIPLKFRIIAQASFRVPHPDCEYLVKCDCPPDVTDCSQCAQTGCTPCE